METIKYYYSKPIKKAFTVVIGHDLYVKYYNDRKYPRMVICSILDRDKGTLSIGWSISSEKDKFVKETGKRIAYERARNNPNKIIKVRDGFNESDCSAIRYEIFNEFYDKTVGPLMGKRIL